MPLHLRIEPGEWYFVVTCPSCGKREAIGKAPAPESAEGVVTYAFSHTVNCDCDTQTIHPPGQNERLRATASGGWESGAVVRPPPTR